MSLKLTFKQFTYINSFYAVVMLLPSVTECIAFATYATFFSLRPARLIRPSRVRKMEYSEVIWSHMSQFIPDKKDYTVSKGTFYKDQR